MSKATFNPPFRACLFRVACVDWQGHPRSVGMSRLYSLTIQWERREADSGMFHGKFGDPISFGAPASPWSLVVSAVRQHLHLMISLDVGRPVNWRPFYIVSGDACSERMVKELRSIIASEHAFEGDEGLATSLPRTVPSDTVF